jgi:GR25 family glycosyltransferase involved in LPS biosynthesis
MDIYIAHEGMDSFFVMSDTGFIFSRDDAEKEPELVDDLENGYSRSSCETVGYEITPGLAKMFYELAKSYWDYENSKG